MAQSVPFVGQPGPGADCFAIVPSDGTAQPQSFRGIYVGVTGDITLMNRLGAAVTFVGVPQGTILPVESVGNFVNATGTTATSLVGIA